MQVKIKVPYGTKLLCCPKCANETDPLWFYLCARKRCRNDFAKDPAYKT